MALLLNSFLPEAKDLTWRPVPGTHLRPGAWPSSCTLFSCNLFTKVINKSISYLSLCLSLNSFCAETWRTWASLSPETSCVVSVGRLWVGVPSEVCGFSLSPRPMSLDSESVHRPRCRQPPSRLHWTLEATQLVVEATELEQRWQSLSNFVVTGWI